MKIKTKQRMYELQSNLRFGNCLNTWDTPIKVRQSSYNGPIAIRSMVPGIGMQTHINQKDLEQATEEYIVRNRCFKIIYSEMVAPSMGIRRILNGQLTRFENGLHLEYGLANEHLNEAMRNPMVAKLLTAKIILESITDPSDNNDLMDLLEEFENPIIEFSILDRLVGWANRRMVVWEVRHY